MDKDQDKDLPLGSWREDLVRAFFVDGCSALWFLQRCGITMVIAMVMVSDVLGWWKWRYGVWG